MKILTIMSHSRTREINSCFEDEQKKQVSNGMRHRQLRLRRSDIPDASFSLDYSEQGEYVDLL